MSGRADGRIPVLYLAPWVDYGGSDKGTIDWFRWLDRSRFAPMLMTTQPSANRRLHEVRPYATELWALPDLMAGHDMPAAIFDVIATRGVRVLHIMNSRLGFELLPDLAALPSPPAVVVQLHVEEEDRSGYVRYVTTRFGNLVDAFSISSEHLAAAVEGYDVPRPRIRVIHTGVDAEAEFSPERATPGAGLDGDAFNVLYPGRLVDQKDPLLMVDVAARLIAERPETRIHVVGDGPLEPAVRKQIRTRGLEREISLHPPGELLSWYAGCDALLMTSAFEGVPYVVYEAMAMGLPIVAPALPGNAELLGAGDPGLIEPRDDAAGYAAALARLASEPEQRAAIGAAHRERARRELSVRAMADAHGALYDELLARRDDAEPAPAAADPPPPEPVRLPTRPRRGTPLVSVVIPCFNHGRYLPSCLQHVRAQSWPELEVIVIDDASTEPDTLAVLDRLERDGGVKLIRQASNGGPSRARNAGIAQARGRYVLPVDADNLLLPDAVERLVEQLVEANERVGFVYPNLQYFGTRRDYFEAPPYNLFALLFGNYCDTCSLVDRSVYDAGIRFPEDIVLGHEDWDIALALADRGIRGEPARAETLLYRKHGFTRSDTVEHSTTAFQDELRGRHPGLYGGSRAWGRFGPAAGPPASIKARWAPGVSLIALAPIEPDGEAGQRLGRRLFEQSTADVELILRSERDWTRPAEGPAIRRLPAGLADTAAAALGDALRIAKGRLTVVTDGTGSELLEHPPFIEQLVRIFAATEDLRAVVLTDLGPGVHPLRPLAEGEAPNAVPHTVAFPTRYARELLPEDLWVDEDDPVDSVVRVLAWGPGNQWRHSAGSAPPAARRRRRIRTRRPGPRNSGERVEREFLAAQQPSVPSLSDHQVRRWTLEVSWAPAEALLLCRHKHIDGERRVYTHDRDPPRGHRLEFFLGALHRFQVPGSAELHQGGSEGFTCVPDPGGGVASVPGPRRAGTLGFVNEAPLPLLDSLEAAFLPAAGEWVLVCGPDDPLQEHVTERRHLGYVEAFPSNPRRPPHAERRLGLAPLLRTVDREARRHRVAIGAAAAGTLSLELGMLHDEPQDGSIPIWLADDRIATAAHRPGAARPDRTEAARWAAAPLAWRGVEAGPLGPRVRAAVRRFATVARPGGGSESRPADGAPDGYVWPGPDGELRRQIFAAVHPVTGDQLVTPWPLEAADMGYRDVTPLGWVLRLAPVSGTLDAQPVSVPWASRFGRAARRS